MRSLRAAPESHQAHRLHGPRASDAHYGLVSEGRRLPCKQMVRVRLPTGPPLARASSPSTSSFSVHGSIWLEHSVRVGGIGGSNPPAQTEHVPSGRGSSCRRGPIW